MTTKRTRLVTAAVLLIAAALTAPAVAGDGEQPDRRRRRGVERGDDRGDTAGLMFVHRLRKRLDLDSAQVLDLLPLFDRIEEIRRTSRQRREEIAGQLRRLYRAQSDDAARIDGLVRELGAEEDRARSEQEAVHGEMLALLAPKQRAGLTLATKRQRGPGHGPGDRDPAQARAWRRGRRDADSTRERPKPPGDRDETGLDSTMSVFFVHRLRRHLELDDDQARALLPHLEQIGRLRKQHREARRPIFEELAALARDDDADGDRVDRLIGELGRLERAVQRDLVAERSALLARLEPHQRAGFLLFTNRFRDMVERHKRRVAGGAGEGRP